MAVNGYTRQAAANISASLDINAEDFNAEFNAIQTAFDTSTGHTHDGTAGGGQIITKLGSTSSIALGRVFAFSVTIAGATIPALSCVDTAETVTGVGTKMAYVVTDQGDILGIIVKAIATGTGFTLRFYNPTVSDFTITGTTATVLGFTLPSVLSAPS